MVPIAGWWREYSNKEVEHNDSKVTKEEEKIIIRKTENVLTKIKMSQKVTMIKSREK